MSSDLPKSLTLLVDKREQTPIPLPDTIQVVNPFTESPTRVLLSHDKARLTRGDYTVQGYEDVVAIERKASLDEIAQNLCTPDKRRAADAFDRLLSVRHPVLWVEGHPSRLTATRFTSIPPLRAQVAFHRFVRDHPTLSVLVMPAATTTQRREVGNLLTLFLVQTVYDAIHQEVLEACRTPTLTGTSESQPSLRASSKLSHPQAPHSSSSTPAS